ncbi:Unknown protein, partial [Striga hermonthica]
SCSTNGDSRAVTSRSSCGTIGGTNGADGGATNRRATRRSGATPCSTNGDDDEGDDAANDGQRGGASGMVEEEIPGTDRTAWEPSRTRTGVAGSTWNGLDCCCNIWTGLEMPGPKLGASGPLPMPLGRILANGPREVTKWAVDARCWTTKVGWEADIARGLGRAFRGLCCEMCWAEMRASHGPRGLLWPAHVFSSLLGEKRENCWWWVSNP